MSNNSANYDTCPKCGASTLEPDGKEFNVLHCSKCDWDIGIRIVEAGRTYGLGAIIALVVLLLCVILAAIGHVLTPFLVLVLIALLALAYLVG